MPTVTFKVTATREKLERVFLALDELEVRYQKEKDPPASSKEDFQNEDSTVQLSQKDRLLKRYRERSHLKGRSEDRQKLRQDFRDDFQW